MRSSDLGRLLARFGRMRESETFRAKARLLLERQLARTPDDEFVAAAFAELLPDAGASRGWTVLDPVVMTSAGGATLTRLADGSVVAGGQNPKKDTYTVEARTTVAGITALRLEALPDPSLVNLGPGRSHNGNFILDGIQLTTVTELAAAVPVCLIHARAGHWQEGGYIYRVSGALDPFSERAWGIWPRSARPHWAVFEADRPFGTPEGTTLRVELRFWSAHNAHVIGRFRLSVTDRPLHHVLAGLRLQAIKADDSRHGLTRLGAAYSLLGEWTSAAGVLTRATARPDAPALDSFLLALAQHHLGQLDEARSECDRGLARLRSDLADDATFDEAIEALVIVRGLSACEAEGLLLDRVFPANPLAAL
jgi:hypothetical protein